VTYCRFVCACGLIYDAGRRPDFVALNGKMADEK
jgi:hypothetical protein